MLLTQVICQTNCHAIVLCQCVSKMTGRGLPVETHTNQFIIVALCLRPHSYLARNQGHPRTKL